MLYLKFLGFVGCRECGEDIPLLVCFYSNAHDLLSFKQSNSYLALVIMLHSQMSLTFLPNTVFSVILRRHFPAIFWCARETLVQPSALHLQQV